VGKSQPNELENGDKNDRKIIFKIFCGTLGAFPLWISQSKTTTSILKTYANQLKQVEGRKKSSK